MPEPWQARSGLHPPARERLRPNPADPLDIQNRARQLTLRPCQVINGRKNALKPTRATVPPPAAQGK